MHMVPDVDPVLDSLLQNLLVLLAGNSLVRLMEEYGVLLFKDRIRRAIHAV